MVSSFFKCSLNSARGASRFDEFSALQWTFRVTIRSQKGN